ncbi:MAG: RpiB/LacA/LacB family sugar-phosphate isomerase [Kofleriaceae bacterium]
MISQLGPHTGKHIVFGFDHHGLPEVDAYVASLSRFGLVLSAVHSEQPHYLSSTQRVCERVRGRTDAVGVLVCSTGMGVSIAANKFSGIYAARCLSVDDAAMSRQVNNCNVLCLALKTGLATNAAIIEAFMTTAYEGRKLEQLARITLLEHDLVPMEPARPRALKSV